ncbi:YitT family protein [bacterium]|nr:YitT family protein [bacterium]
MNRLLKIGYRFFFKKEIPDPWLTFVVSNGGIVVAGIIYALALKYFLYPSNVILAGFEGVSVSIAHYFDKSALFVILYTVFQGLLLTFSFFKISRRFTYKTLLLVCTVIILLVTLPPLSKVGSALQSDRILLVLFGGLLAGVGKAIALKCRGSIGDEDIISAYLAQRTMRPVGEINLIAGVFSTLFGLSLVYLKTGELAEVITILMYTAIYLFISSETVNALFRKYRLTKVVLFTQSPDRVVPVLNSISDDRTYTLQSGTGGYSQQPLSIITTIVTHEELPMILRKLKKVERNSFVYFHDIEGVAGRFHIDPIG